jgi:hypothetical protein
MSIPDPTGPWAVVLMSIEGSSPPADVPARMQQLFRRSDPGIDPTLADFWHDVTQGTVDISTSDVFGWYDSGFTMIGTPGLTPYPGVAGSFQRPAPVDHARTVLQQNNPGLDLSHYRSILAVYNFGCDGGNSGRDVVWGTAIGDTLSWAESGWRRCQKCSCLVITAGASSPCSEGGTHDVPPSEPVRFAPTNSGTLSSTSGYTTCGKCGRMFASSTTAGCPAGGAHASDGSAYYLLTGWAGGIGDGGWTRCRACGSIVQGDGTGLTCLATTTLHDLDTDKGHDFNFPMRDFTYELQFLGHEMGHAFGFIHSRSSQPDTTDFADDGFPGAYGDRFDIMSAKSCDSFTPALPASDRPGLTGPALSAHHLLTQDLLPQSSIHRVPFSTAQNWALLRPVDSPSAAGSAVVQVGNFIAELRMLTGPNGAPSWDRALDFGGAGAAVVIHDVADPGPVRLESTRGLPYLLQGDMFEARVLVEAGAGPVTARITVNSIDPVARQAALSINLSPYPANTWQRWLVLPCQYLHNVDPAIPLPILRSIMTDGVESYFSDMSSGLARIAGSYTLSALGNRGDKWFAVEELHPPTSAADRAQSAITQILAAQVPSVDGKTNLPFLLDWRWFTGIIVINDVAAGNGYLGRTLLPTGNTPTVAGMTGLGNAAGTQMFDLVEIGGDHIDVATIAQAIGESLGLPQTTGDPYHLMSSVADRIDYTSSAPVGGVTAAHTGPAGPALSSDNLAALGWLGGRDYVATSPTAGGVTSDSVRLAPLGQAGVLRAGYLRAVIGPWTFECRINQNWDAALPLPVQVIAMADGLAPRLLRAGDSVGWVGHIPVNSAVESSLIKLLGGGTVTVAKENTDTVGWPSSPIIAAGATLRYSEETARPYIAGGGVLRGGGTLLFTLDGRVLHLPPGDPWEGRIRQSMDDVFRPAAEDLAQRNHSVRQRPEEQGP